MERKTCINCGYEISGNNAGYYCAKCGTVQLKEEEIQAAERKYNDILSFTDLAVEKIGFNTTFLGGNAAKAKSFVEKVRAYQVKEQQLLEKAPVSEWDRKRVESYFPAFSTMKEAYDALTASDKVHIDNELLKRYEDFCKTAKKINARLEELNTVDRLEKERAARKELIKNYAIKSSVTLCFALLMIPFMFTNIAWYYFALSLVCVGHSVLFYDKKEAFDGVSFDKRAIGEGFIQRIILQGLLAVELIITVTAVKLGGGWLMTFSLALVVFMPNAYGIFFSSKSGVEGSATNRFIFLCSVAISATFGFGLVNNIDGFIARSEWNSLWIVPIFSALTLGLPEFLRKLIIGKISEKSKRESIAFGLCAANVAFMFIMAVVTIVKIFTYHSFSFGSFMAMLLFLVFQAGVGIVTFVWPALVHDV